MARRAGDVRRGELRPAGTCRWRGAVDASRDDRWFIYVELDDAGRRLELWVPLASDEPVAEVDRRLYEPQSQPSNRIQAVAGALLYAVVMGLLVVTARSTRRLVISKLT